MVNNNQIGKLYGDVDNLGCFVHPKYNRSFHFLSDNAVVELGARTVDEIAKTGYKQIVVSETGATPFAYICKRIADRRGLGLRWIPFKVPRNPTRNIHPMLMYHLSQSERDERLPHEQADKATNYLNECGKKAVSLDGKTRDEALKIICNHISSATSPSEEPSLATILAQVGRSNQQPIHEAVSSVLEGTVLSRTFSHPFLYFDEYIDSGTTLRSAQSHFNFFTGKLAFKIGTYFAHIEESRRFDKLAFSLYDRDSEFECYLVGAYPFENRVDIIGHYYHMDDEEFVRVDLESLVDEFKPRLNTDEFIGSLMSLSRKEELLQRVKGHSQIPEVREFIEENHLARYCIALSERLANGRKRHHEFLWQLFEMYGPIWSPLPDDYHLDFLAAFEKTQADIQNTTGFKAVSEQYVSCRPTIMGSIARSCLERRQKWLSRMDALLEVS